MVIFRSKDADGMAAPRGIRTAGDAGVVEDLPLEGRLREMFLRKPKNAACAFTRMKTADEKGVTV